MEKQSRLGCVAMGGLAVFLVLLLGAGWWFFRPGAEMTDAPPPETMFVFLLSPASGDEVEVGDHVPVSINAFGLNPFARAELFSNGVSLGVVNDFPEDAFWAWQPLSVGIHSLTARVTDVNGEIGQSQTVIVNVLQGDGLVQVTALEGQTLEEIGAGFGVPPAQMVVANPNIDSGQPLPDGASVQVPIGDEAAGNESGQAGEGVSIPLIFWEFTPLTPVDKSYCYTSSGEGSWVKMPKKPFDFFSGSPLKYIQQDGIPKAGAGVIQVRCWGWLGETLKFLGEGETKFDVFQSADKLEILGQGFQLTGKPQIPLSGSPPETGGENTKTIPPPFALREPADTADCTEHFGNILAGFVCDALLNASVKNQWRVLQWEWEPGVNLPGNDVWFNEIDGYRIYEIDPLTNSYKFLADIKNPKQKAVAVPLPWGPSRCYHIWAYVNDPVIKDFGGDGYCPGQPPAAQKITVSPTTHWLTTGGTWVNKDCGDLNPNVYDPGIASNFDPKFGQTAGEVLVGSFMETYDGCNMKGHYYGGVKFSLLEYPIDGIISKAVLKFSHEAHVPLAATKGVAYPTPTSCVANVGTAKQDWSGAGYNENHYLKNNILAGPGYYAPVISLSPYTMHNVDVTFIVKHWYKLPSKNHGFILAPTSVPYPQHDDGGHSVCMSWLRNFELEIHYFVP